MQARASLDRNITTILAIASASLLALAPLAFWRGYVSRLPAGPDSFAHLHAILATAWLLLLIAQPLLIRRRKLALHRWVGRISWVLAPSFVAVAVLLAHHRFAQMDDTVFSKAAYALYLPLSMTALFAASYVFALVCQRDTRLHARFMICTALTAIDPIISRVLAFHVIELEDPIYQAVNFSVMVLALVMLAISLPAASHARRVFTWFAAGFTAVLALWFWLPNTAPWFYFAQWFRSLPIS